MCDIKKILTFANPEKRETMQSIILTKITKKFILEDIISRNHNDCLSLTDFQREKIPFIYQFFTNDKVTI